MLFKVLDSPGRAQAAEIQRFLRCRWMAGLGPNPLGVNFQPDRVASPQLGDHSLLVPWREADVRQIL